MDRLTRTFARASEAPHRTRPFRLATRAAPLVAAAGFGALLTLAAAGVGVVPTAVAQDATPAAGVGWQPDPSCQSTDPVVQAAIEATIARTGPQTEWFGPTEGPQPEPGTEVVYIPTDAQNALSVEWGEQITDAAQAIGWEVTVIDGKGTAQGWTAALNQAIALQPAAIMTSMDVTTVKDLALEAEAQGIKVIGLHGVALPGPAPDVGLFSNITSDPNEIGKAEADYIIADSCGTGKAIILYDGNYEIARTKAEAMRDQFARCTTCELLEYVNSPLSEITTRTPQVFSNWVAQHGTGWYAMTIYDGYYDFGIPALRSGGVEPDQVMLVGSDGTKEAYDRIRAGEYQVATVPEPPSLQAYQALDDAVRAAAGMEPANWTQPVFLVTTENIGIEGGPESSFVPSNDFKQRYLELWGVG